MIQLNNPMNRELLIVLGRVLQESKEFELGYFYAEKEEFGDVVVWLRLPGNGHLIGRHHTVHYLNSNGHPEIHFKAAQELAQDLNTLLNLKAPQDLSNTP